jgi:hypothetical protein
MFNLKDFERWVCRVVRGHNSPKGGQDIGGGGPALISLTVGSLFRTPCEKEKRILKISLKEMQAKTL